MRTLARWVERLSVDGKRLKPREVVAEFDNYLHDELDLVREAANAAQLRRNMEGLRLVMVPEMIWDLCTQSVIVMERMKGVPISQIAAPARGRRRHQEAGARRRDDLLHPGVPRRLLPRRHAPGQHPGQHRAGHLRPLHRAGLRHRRHADRVRQGIPGAELHRLLPARLQARGRTARRERLGAAGDARRRARRRDPRRLRAALRPAAEGHLARPGAAAPVPDLAALQRRDPAAARAAAEDAAQRRRPGPPARPRPRPVEHRQALPRALDERADRLARPGRAAEERGAALRATAARAAAPGAPGAAARAAAAATRGCCEALLAEQRRTNRLLLALSAGLAGFAAGAMLVLALLRWNG